MYLHAINSSSVAFKKGIKLSEKQESLIPNLYEYYGETLLCVEEELGTTIKALGK